MAGTAVHAALVAVGEPAACPTAIAIAEQPIVEDSSCCLSVLQLLPNSWV